MKSYPIWNQINSCIYKVPKSYGIKDHNTIKTFIGTSKINSWEFAQITFRHIRKGDDRIYQIYLDQNLIKSALLQKGNDPIIKAQSAKEINLNDVSQLSK
jgi:hypothetical protein